MGTSVSRSELNWWSVYKFIRNIIWLPRTLFIYFFKTFFGLIGGLHGTNERWNRFLYLQFPLAVVFFTLGLIGVFYLLYTDEPRTDAINSLMIILVSGSALCFTYYQATQLDEPLLFREDALEAGKSFLVASVYLAFAVILKLGLSQFITFDLDELDIGGDTSVYEDLPFLFLRGIVYLYYYVSMRATYHGIRTLILGLRDHGIGIDMDRVNDTSS